MIGEEQIKKMKEGAILINTAREGLVDDVALEKAVCTGTADLGDIIIPMLVNDILRLSEREEPELGMTPVPAFPTKYIFQTNGCLSGKNMV